MNGGIFDQVGYNVSRVGIHFAACFESGQRSIWVLQKLFNYFRLVDKNNSYNLEERWVEVRAFNKIYNLLIDIDVEFDAVNQMSE